MTTAQLRTRRLAAVDPRLGRHIEHDNRSKAYPARSLPGQRSRLWSHEAPVLVQGDLGCCTGAATAQLLNCSSMQLARRAARGDNDYLTLDDAVGLYSRATQLDHFAGEYPPEDTGSSGLAVAKAAAEAGYVSEYRHVFGLPHLLTAVQMAPVIVGTYWYQGMSKLRRRAVATPTGAQLGGHQYLCLGVNFDDGLLTFLNSWGDSWGKRGRFYMTFEDFGALLADDGDATVLVGATPNVLPERKLHAAPDDKDGL